MYLHICMQGKSIAAYVIVPFAWELQNESVELFPVAQKEVSKTKCPVLLSIQKEWRYNCPCVNVACFQSVVCDKEVIDCYYPELAPPMRGALC
jgi:hypothetical protein